MSAQVLITGVTGHVGSGVLIKALEKGYSVRAAVRSLNSKDVILEAPAIKDNALGNKLTFVEVPDILAPGAYSEAVKGVEYVIHLASPIMRPHFAGTNLKETVVDPAIHGTINILEAALANPKIKRVVITSSILANSDLADPSSTANPHTREPVPEYSELSSAYRAAKHAAILASDAFMTENQPHYDLINIMPGFVVGRKELATSAAEVMTGSNGVAFGLALNGVQPSSVPGATVHLDDVALIHVKALELPGHGNRDFGMVTDFNPNDVFGILKMHFPQAVENGTFKQPAGQQPFHYMKWDASETEKVFDIRFKGVEEQIVPVAQQFLQLQAKA
jgi:nucleoside-diphosphate-sugar epimerase